MHIGGCGLWGHISLGGGVGWLQMGWLRPTVQLGVTRNKRPRRGKALLTPGGKQLHCIAAPRMGQVRIRLDACVELSGCVRLMSRLRRSEQFNIGDDSHTKDCARAKKRLVGFKRDCLSCQLSWPVLPTGGGNDCWNADVRDRKKNANRLRGGQFARRETSEELRLFRAQRNHIRKVPGHHSARPLHVITRYTSQMHCGCVL